MLRFCPPSVDTVSCFIIHAPHCRVFVKFVVRWHWILSLQPNEWATAWQGIKEILIPSLIVNLFSHWEKQMAHASRPITDLACCRQSTAASDSWQLLHSPGQSTGAWPRLELPWKSWHSQWRKLSLCNQKTCNDEENWRKSVKKKAKAELWTWNTSTLTKSRTKLRTRVLISNHVK